MADVKRMNHYKIIFAQGESDVPNMLYPNYPALLANETKQINIIKWVDPSNVWDSKTEAILPENCMAFNENNITYVYENEIQNEEDEEVKKYWLECVNKALKLQKQTHSSSTTKPIKPRAQQEKKKKR